MDLVGPPQGLQPIHITHKPPIFGNKLGTNAHIPYIVIIPWLTLSWPPKQNQTNCVSQSQPNLPLMHSQLTRMPARVMWTLCQVREVHIAIFQLFSSPFFRKQKIWPWIWMDFRMCLPAGQTSKCVEELALQRIEEISIPPSRSAESRIQRPSTAYGIPGWAVTIPPLWFNCRVIPPSDLPWSLGCISDMTIGIFVPIEINSFWSLLIHMNIKKKVGLLVCPLPYHFWHPQLIINSKNFLAQK